MIGMDRFLLALDHWLRSKPNAYLGSDYGPDLQGLLLKPLSIQMGNELIRKLKADVPIFAQLDSEQLRLYSASKGFETEQVFLVIGETPINLNEVLERINNGESNA